MFGLERDAFGKLVFTAENGERTVGVMPVRAFPISAPDAGLSIVDGYGHELAWVDSVSALPPDMQTLLGEELAAREFMPVIQRIVGVTAFATPCTWHVVTDHGETRFTLKGEEHIRRLGQTGLMIADSHGIHYLVRERKSLDGHSQKILDRFL